MKVVVGAHQIQVSFYYPSPLIDSHKRAIRKATKLALTMIPKSRLRGLKKNVPYGLEISFVSKPRIKQINYQFRKKDRPTDVLSFPRMDESLPPTMSPEIGELIICPSVARDQAKQWENSFPQELSRLVVHGILHLFGYDHETSKEEETKMFRLQEKIINRL